LLINFDFIILKVKRLPWV